MPDPAPTDRPSFTQLNDDFGQVPGLTFEAGDGGLTRAAINTPACTGAMYLHGGHVTHWQPAGQQPVLWMSREAIYDGDTAMRGGIPVCFPWFADHPTDPSAPAHGPVRTTHWRVIETGQDGDAVTVTMAVEIPGWSAQIRSRFGPNLTTELTVTNTADTKARFEAALHTYFAVKDSRSVSISGLEHTDYIDKTEPDPPKNQGPDPITFTGYTDRIYQGTEADCVLDDPGWGRQVVVSKRGSRSTVVWNPWMDKAAAMKDFGDDEWPDMCCIETAAVGEHAVTLAPGASHVMTSTVSVRSR